MPAIVPLFPSFPSFRRRPRGPATRWRRRRRAVGWWVATAALAMTTFATVDGVTSRAAARERSWGEMVEVPVARRTIAAGTVIESGDIRPQRMPRRLVPRGSVVDDPAGQTARVTIWPGEVMLAERLAPAGLHGLAATLPAGSRALAVPRGESAPPLEVGDRVDVLATFDVAPPAGDGEGLAEPADGPPTPAPTFAVASGAIVLHLADESVTIAVGIDDSARVAFALARGTITLALAGA